MASTADGVILVDAFRRTTAEVMASAGATAAQAFDLLLDPSDLDRSFAAYSTVATRVVNSHRAEASAAAGAFVTAFRASEGVPGTVPARLAGAVVPAQAATSLLVTGPVTVKRALASGASLEVAMARGRLATAGAASRLAVNAARETVIATVASDKRAVGWARATDGQPCYFCAMLASRGPVYKSEGSADFRSHGRCGCVATPVYSYDQPWPPGASEFRDLYDEQIAGRYSAGRMSGKAGQYPSNRALQEWRKVYDAARREGRFGVPTPEAVAKAAVPKPVDALGYYAREVWPEWARTSRLGELLDSLPADRSRLGMREARTLTEAELQTLARDVVAQRYGLEFESWDAMVAWAKKEATPAKIRRLEARYQKAQRAVWDFEYQHGTGTLTPTRQARYDRLKAADRASYAEVSKAEKIRYIVDNEAEIFGPDPQGVARYHAPTEGEMLTARERLEKAGPDLSMTGEPGEVFAAHLDAMDEIGAIVDREASRRWAEEFGDMPNPSAWRDEIRAVTDERQWIVRARADAAQAGDWDLRESLDSDLDRLNDRVMRLAGTSFEDSHFQRWSEITRDVIAEVRPLTDRAQAERVMVRGDAQTVVDALSKYGGKKHGSASLATDADMALHYDGFGYYPQTMGDAFEAANANPVRIIRTSRGYNAGDVIAVSGTGGSGLSTAVHEIGHSMERAVAALPRLEFAHLWRRATVSDARKWVREKIYSHIDDEFQIPAGYHEGYSAKIYGSPQDVLADALADLRQYFEVFTTGTQVAFPRGLDDLDFHDRAFRETIIGWLMAL